MERPKCECGSMVWGLIYMRDRYWCIPCVEQRIAALEAALEGLKGLEQLTKYPGAAVTIHTPDCIGVDAAWTGWKEKRFVGKTLAKAIQKAVKHRHKVMCSLRTLGKGVSDGFFA